jgi:hypothetical protein
MYNGFKRGLSKELELTKKQVTSLEKLDEEIGDEELEDDTLQ